MFAILRSSSNGNDSDAKMKLEDSEQSELDQTKTRRKNHYRHCIRIIFLFNGWGSAHA